MTTDVSTHSGSGIAPVRPRMLARAIGTLAGTAAIGIAVYQVSTSGPPAGASYETLSDYVREALFLIYLIATIGAVLSARSSRWAPTWPARLIIGGYALITTGVTIGLAVREELDWFFALAGPGLVASTIGFVAWAVWSRRNDVLPAWAALLLGVGGAVAILLSEVGTSVLIGAFWFYLAWVGPPTSPTTDP